MYFIHVFNSKIQKQRKASPDQMNTSYCFTNSSLSIAKCIVVEFVDMRKKKTIKPERQYSASDTLD